jgi:hypothetical protein
LLVSIHHQVFDRYGVFTLISGAGASHPVLVKALLISLVVGLFLSYTWIHLRNYFGTLG